MPHVSLLRGFCPLCYRGHGTESERVPTDCARIDEEQRQCSVALRGLPLLDLSAEGRRCREPCRLICLVCGNPMAFPCEREYEDALRAVERYEEALEETRAEVLDVFASLKACMVADLERGLRKSLRALGLAWHARWGKPVHLGCIKKAPCECLLPVCASVCPAHPARPARPAKKTPMPKPPPPAVVMPASSARGATRPIVTVKATWLSKPSASVSVQLPAGDTPAPIVARKALPPKRKPNQRLEDAASKCLKLDGWAGTASARLQPSAAKRSFSGYQHAREFDPYLHGYFKRNGMDMYRFPHGEEVQVFSGVNTLTEDGRLVPD